MPSTSIQTDLPEPLQPQERITLCRNLLLAAREPDAVQDRIDCADMALHLGLRDVAKALYEVAFIRAGFAPERMQWQARTAARVGLWGDVPADGGTFTEAKAFTVDIAVQELKSLLAREDLARTFAISDEHTLVEPTDVKALPSIVDVDPSKTGPVLKFTRTPDSAEAPLTPVPPVAEVFEMCSRLYGFLHAPEAGADLEKALEAALQTYVTPRPFDPSGEVSDPKRTAAALIAADMRYFLLSYYPLAYHPLGSAEMLHTAARSAPNGLGAYMSNVPRLLRSWRDIFGLLQLGVGGPPDEEIVTRWLPLLVTHVDGSLLHDIIDELGDQALHGPLWAILSTMIAQSGLRRDNGMLWKIRDAGLDNGDMELAARAQRVVAVWSRDNELEWRILAEIYATFGKIDDAEHALQLAWSIAPDDRSFALKIKSLSDSETPPIRITKGFGTAPERQRLRLARRNAASISVA